MKRVNLDNNFESIFQGCIPKVNKTNIVFDNNGTTKMKVSVNDMYDNNELVINYNRNNKIKQAIKMDDNDKWLDFLLLCNRKNNNILIKNVNSLEKNLREATKHYMDNQHSKMVKNVKYTTSGFELKFEDKKNKCKFFMKIEELNDNTKYRVNYFWKEQFGHIVTEENSNIYNLVNTILDVITDNVQ